jgi:WD40 repeat-containing protein SMU1
LFYRLHDSSKEKRRQEIAEALSIELSTVPPSRLLSLLGQALRFQQAQGLLPPGQAVDVFRGGRRSARKDQEDKAPRRQAGFIKFSVDSHPETVCFSPDGVSMVTGSADGFIEVWDFESCKLRTDLEYQAKDELMMHEGEPILCSAFSRDGELLASGSRDGKVKVWKVSDGLCVRKFVKAHSQGITSVAFSKDGLQLLTTSFDSLVRIHGLKSGKMLKEFRSLLLLMFAFSDHNLNLCILCFKSYRGHTSFVNSACFSKDGSQVLSASSDGTVRLWDVRTSDSILSFRPAISVGVARETTVHTLILMPNNPDHVLVGVKGPQAFIMTLQGQLLKTFSSGKQSGGDFLSISVSPHGKWVYCVGEDGVMYIFDAVTGQLDNVLEVSRPTAPSGDHGREIIGLAHHPSRNVMASITDDGILKTWKQ